MRDSSSPISQELEADLSTLRRAADDVDLDDLFSGVRESMAHEEARPATKLRAQPTWRRRLFAVLTVLLVFTGAGVLKPRPDLGHYPLWLLVLITGAFALLIFISAMTVLRPAYVPGLTRWQRWALGGWAIAAALILAVVPRVHSALRPVAEARAWEHALPCFGYGLLAGLPVYILLRLLDRGAPLGRVLAAAAAGLTGNLVLELHCPVGGSEHLMMGHALVVAVFVGAACLVETVLCRRGAGRSR